MKFKTTRGLTIEKLESEFPSYYNKMVNFLIEDDDITLSEKIWLFQNELKQKPKCLNCNSKVSFTKFYKGYRTYCSRSCATKYSHGFKEVKDKRVKKMIECNNNPKTRKKMTESANITKSNFSDTKKREINNKRSKTVNDKWGVKNISNAESIKQKISTRLQEVLPGIRLEKTKDRITSAGFSVIDIDNGNFKLLCSKCKKEFNISSKLFNQRNRFDIEPCLNCNPNNNDSFFESSICDFIKENYDGEVKDKCRDFKKYEIDVYLPELSIGFECNGLWWHSERYKENSYHKSKNDFFKEKGIQIIHIWEDDWKFKKEIIKSRVLNIVSKTNERIWGRKCEIREVNSNVYRKFVDKNHLQGHAPAKYKLGLYYNDNLVSVMSFSKLRRNLGYKTNPDNHYELLRFCSSKNTTIVGGSSKLLKYFIREYKPTKIISYASKDWSVGNLYNKLGFIEIKETVPNYFYFHKDEGLRINRFNFRKDVLVKEGYDKDKSEHQIMNDRKYYRVYDTGSLLFEMNI
jgi:hypothetical protein